MKLLYILPILLISVTPLAFAQSFDIKELIFEELNTEFLNFIEYLFRLETKTQENTNKINEISAELEIINDLLVSRQIITSTPISSFIPIDENTTEPEWAFTTSGNYQRTTTNGYSLISGDGFLVTPTLQRYIDVSSLGDDEDLHLKLEYRATSNTPGSEVTNAHLEILDENTMSVLKIKLRAGGVTDSGWQTYTREISDLVQGSDFISVKLYLKDVWGTNWRQTASFDGFELTNVSPFAPDAAGTSNSTLTLTLDQEISYDLYLHGSDYTIKKYLSNSPSLELTERVQTLLTNYNMTS